MIRLSSTHRPHAQQGVSLIEFAIVASMLVILLVAATDYSLAILARQEVHGAARTGVEYGINRGYDAAGIKAAALASNGSGGFRYASIGTSDVAVSNAICACYGDIYGSLAKGPESTTPTACSPTAVCPAPAGGGVASARMPYVSVTVSGAYTPLFTTYWFNLTGGQLRLSATYVGKVFFLN